MLSPSTFDAFCLQRFAISQFSCPHLRVATKIEQRDLIGNITLSPTLTTMAGPVRLLFCMVYLASNNLLPVSGLCEIMKWISDQRLLWIVEILMDSQLPSTTIFASLLFNCAVHEGDTDIAAAMLAKGVNPNLIPSISFERTIFGSGRLVPPLHTAIKAANPAVVRLLLTFGAKIIDTPIKGCPINRQSSLDIASEGPRLCLSTIQLLIEHGADVNVPIPEYVGFSSVLNRALELNEVEVSKLLLSSGARVSHHQSPRSVTALQTAARCCNADMVKMVIDAGADVNLPIGSDYVADIAVAKRTGDHMFLVTPLQYATKRNDIAMVEVLLDNGAIVDGFDFHELFSSNYKAHKLYESESDSDDDFDHGSDLDPYDEFLEWNNGGDDDHYSRLSRQAMLYSRLSRQAMLYSPLQSAAANKNVAMVRLLLNHHPSINMMGGVGTALQVACMQQGNMEIVKLLIDNGADVNFPAHDRYGLTALQAAIISGDLKVVDYLLDKKADVKAASGWLFGRTALQAASKMGYAQLASELIQRGANVEEDTSMHDETCLYLAARSGNVNLVRLLLRHGANPDTPPTRTYWSSTVLYQAIRSGKHDVVETLLAYGADATKYNEDKHTIVDYAHAAVQYSSYETLKLLLRRGASPTLADEFGSTPLRVAVSHDSPDLVQLLLSVGGDPNIADNYGWSAFTAAISKQNEKLVRILIDGGAHVDLQGSNLRELPLAVAIDSGNVAIIRMLIAASANVDSPASIIGLTKAVEANRLDVIRLLLSSGLTAKYVSTDDRSYEQPLAKAIGSKNDTIIDMLLAHDPGFYFRDFCALQMAAKNGDLQLLQRLLQLGPPSHPETSFTRALETAAYSGQFSIAVALINAIADFSSLDIAIPYDNLLYKAISSGLPAMVRIFIEKGAHVNPPPGHRCAESRISHPYPRATPLQYAVEKGYERIVDLLLQHGADVNGPGAGYDGKTALEIAAEMGRLECVYKMLCHDKEPQTLGQRIQSAASLATFKGFHAIAKYLEEWLVKKD